MRHGLHRAGKRLRPHTARLVVIAIGVVVIWGAAIELPRIFDDSPGKDPNGQAQVVSPVSVEVPRATQLELVRKNFAPWQIQVANQTSSNRGLLLLTGSGSTEVSDWTVDLDPSQWLKSEPFSLQSLQVNGKRVTITDNRGNTFTVTVGQPFLFESDPGNVFFVSEDHSVWSTSFQTALTNRVAA